MITVYQPQVERWADNNLSGRAAVSVTAAGRERTSLRRDRAQRAHRDRQVRRPGHARRGAHHQVQLSRREPGGGREVPRHAARRGDEGRAGRCRRRRCRPISPIAQARSKQKALPVKNDPPQILFRTAPSMLVLIDGEPALREAKDAPGLKRVINTAALMLLEESSSTYSPRALGRWWQSKALDGGWKSGPAPPATLEQRARRARQAVRPARRQGRRRQAGVRAGRNAADHRGDQADRAAAVARASRSSRRSPARSCSTCRTRPTTSSWSSARRPTTR